jgi:LuxR family maltose regulon positive regulatory protein
MGQSVDRVVNLLSTKTELPEINFPLLARKSLAAALNAHISTPVIALTSPTGYGKTTLLVEWLRDESNCDRLIIWLALDSYDNSLIKFLSYISTSLIKTYPRLYPRFKKYLNFIHESGDPTNYDPLINEISQIPQKIVIVFDDYQVITNADIHACLEYLMAHQPKNLQMVFSSRESLPFSLSRLRTHEDIFELTTADLSLSLDQTRLYLAEYKGLNLSPNQVDSIYSATDGWIAGLKLLTLSIHNPVDLFTVKEGVAENNPRVLEYLTEEVLNIQGDQVKEFLLKTSILPEFSAALCDAVFHRNDSTEMISQIEQRKLFIIPSDRGGRWYKYHPMFARSMQTVFLRTYRDEMSAIHHQACDWLVNNGHPDKAISHALILSDFETAARILDEWSMDAIRNLDLNSLVLWISYIPRDFFYRYPQLGINYALANYLLYKREIGQSVLMLIEEVYQRHPEKLLPENDTVHARWKIACMRALFATGSTHSRELIDQLVHLIDTSPEGDEYVLGLLYHSTAELYEENSRYDLALQAYDHGLEFARRQNLPLEYIHSICAKARIHKMQGRLAEAEALYNLAADDVNKRGLDVSAYDMARTGILQIQLERRNLTGLDLVVKEIENHFDQIEMSTLPEHYFSLLIYRLIGYFIQVGNLDRATYYYHYILKHNQGVLYPITFPEEICIQIDYELAAVGQRQKPVLHTVFLQKLAENPTPSLPYQVALARLDLAHGKPADAIRRLEPALRSSREGKVGELELQILILLAMAEDLRDDQTKALAWLGMALHLAGKEGYIRLFLDQGQAMQGLLRRIHEMHNLNIEDGLFADILLAEFQPEAPESIPAVDAVTAVPAFVNPLSKREMDVLQLLAEGKSAKEISSALMVSRNTVKAHVKNIYKKLERHTHNSLLQRAAELKLVK